MATTATSPGSTERSRSVEPEDHPTHQVGTSSPALSQSDRTIRAIFDHAAKVGREHQIDALIRLNADFARDLVAADRCTLWLTDPATGELWTRLADGIDATDTTAAIRIPSTQGLVGQCVTDDTVILVNDAARDPRLLRRVDHGSGYRTEQVLCVPLHIEGRVIGAFQLLNKPSGFTEADAGLLGLLAQFTASAIYNERLREEAEGARLIRHELDLARDVQARLLPEPPIAPGLTCIGLCRAAHSIGGDYYDLLPLVDGRFALTLGDVSGKGIPAAVMMASIQTVLRNLLLRNQSAPSDLAALVADLNHTLYISSTAARYSTLLCGVLSADRRCFTYVNAGQVEPMLLHRDGRLEHLPGGGLPVGMLPEASYEAFTTTLEFGDTLVIVSDGIVEAVNPDGDFWPEEEVDRVLLENLAAPVTELPRLLTEAVDRYANGAEQYDDMTVIALRIT